MKGAIKMNMKIVGIFICILMVFTTLNSISYGTNIKKTTLSFFQNPVVEITSPSDETVVTNPIVIVEGNAYSELPMIEYGYSILYPGGGMFSEFWPIDPPVEYYEFEISVNLIEGYDGNVITVYAKDTQYNKGTDVITVYFVPEDEDNEHPQVIISSPEDNGIFMDPGITLQGYVTDNVGLVIFTSYQIWEDEEYEIYSEIFTDPVSSYDFEFDVLLKPGLNTLKVTAYDAVNNKGEDSVEVTKEYECGHRTPTITDNTGNTTFHGIFIGCDHRNTNQEIHGCERGAELMYDTLRNKEGWHLDNMELLLGNQASFNNIKIALAQAINRARPGDEFLFYFSNHGSNSIVIDDNGDEPDGFDEALHLAGNRNMSDDVLSDMLSGFQDCVTITVKLDCCHAGGFFDGEEDVQHATNSDGNEYGPSHINIEAACDANETTGASPYNWDDDGDMVVEPDELTRLSQYHWNDDNGNDSWDPGEEWWWWNDTDNDGEVDDEEELIDSEDALWLPKFTVGNLEGLIEDSIFKNEKTTRADRDNNGITTAKELYEFSILYLYDQYNGDNDNDGSIDEDGWDYREINEKRRIIYLDNDRDGLINEDPGPPSFAFWYDEPPNKPSKPSGPVDGKTGEEYTYTTSTTDPENDDIFYMFEWDDGTESEWLGPYSSGGICSSTHTWNKIGDYQIRVKSRDRCFAESDWATLEVSMPKNKPYITTPFLNFLENHPHMFPLLRQLLEL